MKQPPMTRDELIAVRDAYPDDPIIRRLLREVSRLRAIPLRTRQFIGLLNAKSDYAGTVQASLVEDLEQEPCVQEERQRREDLLAKVRRAEGCTSEDKGILPMVGGHPIAEATQRLPDPSTAEDRPYVVDTDAGHAGLVRLYARRQLLKHNKHSYWSWSVYRAERLE